MITINPYVPNFKRTPAKRTDPTVGASTWAFGSQLWKIKRGVLIINPNLATQYINLEQQSNKNRESLSIQLEDNIKTKGKPPIKP